MNMPISLLVSRHFAERRPAFASLVLIVSTSLLLLKLLEEVRWHLEHVGHIGHVGHVGKVEGHVVEVAVRVAIGVDGDVVRVAVIAGHRPAVSC